MAGGFSSTYQRLRDVDVLPLRRGPAGGSGPDAGWRSLPPLITARVGPAVAALRSGSLLVAGGAGDASAELFESYHTTPSQLAAAPAGAAGGSWSLLPPMLAERSGARACTLADGRVVVIGGLAKGGRIILQTVEAFDPESHRWSELASLNTGRVNFAACVLPGGARLVVAGGETNGLDMSQRIAQSVELYDAASNAWSYLPDMSVERYGCGCGVLPDGAVLIVGGYGGKDNRKPEVIDAQVMMDLAAAAPVASAGAMAPVASAGAMAGVVGGFATLGSGGAGMRLPPVAAARGAASSAPSSGSMPEGGGLGRVRGSGCACCAMFTSDSTKGSARGRHLHSAELLLDFGSGDGNASDWTWVPGPPLRTARKGFADVTCVDGSVLVVGGVDAGE